MIQCRVILLYHMITCTVRYHIISYHIISYHIISYHTMQTLLLCPLCHLSPSSRPRDVFDHKRPIRQHRCRSLRGLRLPKLLFNQLQHELAGEPMAVDQRSPLCELEYSIPLKSHVEMLDSWNLPKKIHVLDTLVTGGMVTYMLVDHDLLVLQSEVRVLKSIMGVTSKSKLRKR